MLTTSERFASVSRIQSLAVFEMILEWLNASEAVAAGSSLADYVQSDISAATRQKKQRTGSAGAHIQSFLQQAASATRPLRLNVFRRAKLIAAFKSRLLAHGLDQDTVAQLTHLLLVQLSGGNDAPGPGSSIRSTSVEPGASRRLPALLAEADASFAQGKYAATADRLREVLAIAPRHAIAHANLGLTLCNLGRYRDAEQELRRAIELNSNCPQAHLALGTLLRAKGDISTSEFALRRAVKQEPHDPRALVDLGLTLGMKDRLNDAKICFEKAARLNSRHPDVLCGFGWLASKEGRFEAAENLYRHALEIEPRKAAAWAALAQLRPMTLADRDWLEGVEQTLAGGVTPHEEAKLRFAMGKCFDDLRNYSRAFEQFKLANELQKTLATPYDRVARARFVDDTVRVYTQERLAHQKEGASGSERPVFVTGMMRSGTSLVEQIIASHPRAAGAGELEFWSATARQHPEMMQRQRHDASFTRKLTDSYLTTLGRHSSDALRIVDKATFNSDHLGLIHMSLPRARIIYLRRDPIDNCLSCYFQDFANMASFTMDLGDLAHYYREHHRLVSHWRAVLPKDVFLEVPYADLVADQEGWSRRIIEFIGLDWDPKVLEFHKTERAVLTASNWQVRQKIYSSSVGRWKNYQKFIGPLLKLRDLSP